MQGDRTHISEKMKRTRYRIVGQGLVGSLLALSLDAEGQEFVVHSAALEGECTGVAPGIVNPLAGRKFQPPEEIDALLRALDRAVVRVQAVTGAQIWHPVPILRVFSDPEAAERVRLAMQKDNRQRFVGEWLPADHFAFLHDVYGSFITREGGWADLPLLKQSVRDWLAGSNRLIETAYEAPATGSTEADADEVVIYCEGWQVMNNPDWAFIPHNPAKGEMLIVRFAEDLPRDRIYNQSCWAQPIDDGLWRVGATYSWSRFDNRASGKAAADLQERLEMLTPVPFTVEDQVGGVRPIVEDYHPVIGRHPQRSNWYILNAMGSKGVMQTPMAVELLVAHLLFSEALPERWAVNRFL